MGNNFNFRKSFLVIFTVLIFKITAQVNPPCISEGFENMAGGSYSTNAIPGWTLSAGSYTSSFINGYCQDYPINPTVVAVGHVTTAPFVLGPNTPSVVPASPFSGNKVFLVNSSDLMSLNSTFKRAEYSFNVTSSNKFFQYAFFANIVNGSHSTCCENHYLKIKMVDCNNNAIPCSSLAIAAPSTGSASCTSAGVNSLLPGTNSLYTNGWQIVSVNLSSYVNTCVKLVAEVGMCVYYGHQQDLWLDTKCSSMPVFVSNGVTSVNGNTINVCNVPTAFLNILATNSHTWVGPLGSFSANSNTFATTPVSGVYTVNYTSPACTSVNSFTFYLNIGTTPNPTVSASNSVICIGGSSNLTINGNGISTYSWSTGSTNSTTVVSPTINTTYTAITTGTSGCTSTHSITITVQNCATLLEQERLTGILNVYPNPSTGEFYISSSSETECEVLDITGKTIQTVFLNKEDLYKQKVSLSTEGVYFIKNKKYPQVIKIIVHQVH